MKKSILIGAFALVSMAACQNETTEMLTQTKSTTEKTAARESEPVKKWDKPSENPFELDGYLHIDKGTLRTAYMGVEFIPVEKGSYDFNLVTEAVNNKDNGYTSRRVASLKCSVQEGDMNIAVVDVCDSGSCQLFTVYTYDNGNQYAYQQPASHNYSMQCAAVYLHSWIYG